MNKIITISREYGAGGHSIGQQVAEKLGIPFYDKDIVRETAKEGGFEPELIEREQEDVSKTNSILKSICTVSSAYFNDSQEAIHEIQKAIILRLAMKGPCVILGRCADVILKEAGIETFNVFVHADDLHRAVRVSELTGIKNATELQKAIAKKDNSRHNYYNHYSGKKWGDSRNYDLSLNSGVIGYDKCVQLIIDAVQEEA
ncbi:MAG: cytidylate kinase-like family protein [Lachnospiraceae bacterium]|nr:cytidylate kinase-like family protein [Lachnospiraceae bacterium]